MDWVIICANLFGEIKSAVVSPLPKRVQNQPSHVFEPSKTKYLQFEPL